MNFVLQDENAANIMSNGKPTLIQRKPLVEKQNNSSPAPAEKAVSKHLHMLLITCIEIIRSANREGSPSVAVHSHPPTPHLDYNNTQLLPRCI